MTGSRCARVRLWRWRRNPLKRRSDVIEAWVVLAGWVIVLIGGLIAGLVAVAAVERSAERQRTERREVPAVLVEDAADRPPAGATTDHRVWAAVRWTEADGSTRTDEARVPPRTRAGSSVTVWTDQNGRITAAPLTEGEARLHAVSGGVLAAASTGGLVWGAVRAARSGLERRRLAEWAAEWERIDTRWRWRTG
ncbi:MULTISPECIES: Rv1733c family protein [Streptomyces]|uniref:Integral membrane protein n=1 Tax=Streptomyces dengpaensis TaxID=2049881 RepID=A0ABM6SKV3_9ACTN|nr:MULTISPECIES: hypothetical protein [Streptomyces]AVH54846.1 hypothetical protein C4B68_02440 [Streptomyces dengpaensis]PIA98576.1 hypothetical protein B1C81_39295 [Streptomyces sp. HG99]